MCRPGAHRGQRMCGCWERNTSPWEEHSVLFTTEPSSCSLTLFSVLLGMSVPLAHISLSSHMSCSFVLSLDMYVSERTMAGVVLPSHEGALISVRADEHLPSPQSSWNLVRPEFHLGSFSLLSVWGSQLCHSTHTENQHSAA